MRHIDKKMNNFCKHHSLLWAAANQIINLCVTKHKLSFYEEKEFIYAGLLPGAVY